MVACRRGVPAGVRFIRRAVTSGRVFLQGDILRENGINTGNDEIYEVCYIWMKVARGYISGEVVRAYTKQCGVMLRVGKLNPASVCNHRKPLLSAHTGYPVLSLPFG